LTEKISFYPDTIAYLTEVLIALDIYLDGRSDINDNGGPNQAMRLQRDVQAAIERLGAE